MKTLKEQIENAAKIAKLNTRINDSMTERKNYLLTLLDVFIDRRKLIICENDKPAKGASFSIVELSDRFRVNYRCGYSRYNYAPCIEILK